MSNKRCHDKILNIASHWLECFVSNIPGVLQSQFLLNKPGNQTHSLVCLWPDNAEVDQELTQVTHESIAKKEAFTQSRGLAVKRAKSRD